MRDAVAEGGRVEETIGFLRERVTRAPRAVVILGSGLSGVAEELVDPIAIPYAEIPGFPRSTVAGHRGLLTSGIWNGVEISLMEGRFHLYEGWLPGAIATPLRALRALGANHLIVTNAAGAVRPGLRPGDLMLIADHINFMFRNPLIGRTRPGEERFPDMSDPYDREMRRRVLERSTALGIQLSQGVYAGVLGPSFETPAELRMLARLGADAVGMSTVPEVVLARALGMRVLGVSCITNSAGSPAGGKLTHEEVLAVAAAASERLTRLLRDALPALLPANLPTEAAS